MDRTLSGATTPGQSGPGSDGNEGVLHMILFSVVSWTLVGLEVLAHRQRCSQCILQPLSNVLSGYKGCLKNF